MSVYSQDDNTQSSDTATSPDHVDDGESGQVDGIDIYDDKHRDDDEDGDEKIEPDLAAAEALNQGTDLTTEVIDATLKDVSPR